MQNCCKPRSLCKACKINHTMPNTVSLGDLTHHTLRGENFAFLANREKWNTSTWSSRSSPHYIYIKSLFLNTGVCMVRQPLMMVWVRRNKFMIILSIMQWNTRCSTSPMQRKWGSGNWHPVLKNKRTQGIRRYDDSSAREHRKYGV